MIRYPVTERALLDAIAAEDPRWFEEALHRTEVFRKLGRYAETSGAWSRIKRVYTTLQFHKCAFCERALEGSDYGRVEHDVEHFRPKGRVDVWNPPNDPDDNEWPYPLGEEWETGYYLLAYHPWNYVTACKTCNSALKRSYFPVAGTRPARPPEHPRDCRSEQAYLVYPLGSLDTDPERVLTFESVLARPVSRRASHVRRRAETVIAFFRLNEREELLRARAEQLIAYLLALAASEGSEQSTTTMIGAARLQQMLAPGTPHVSCVRAFAQLAKNDRKRAERIALAALEYVEAESA